MNLDGTFKQFLKECILSALLTPFATLRTQVAGCITAIAKIEIPRKEWMDLIPSLCGNASHENPLVKVAALQTLSLLSEDLLPEELSDPLKSQIIAALSLNIVESPKSVEEQKFVEYAIKGLFNAIPMASHNFQVS